MKEHDILGISVFDDKEEIEKAYQTKLAAINASSGYKELAKGKIDELTRAKEQCLIYRDSTFSQKIVGEIKDVGRSVADTNTLNNLCPFGPVFILGNLCGAKGGYYECCSMSSNSDCCSGLCEDVGYTFCGLFDTSLWFIIGGAIGFLIDRSKKKEQQAKEAEAKRVSAENLHRLQNAAQALNASQAKSGSLQQEMDRSKQMLDDIEAENERRIKRLVTFCSQMNFNITESQIRKSNIAVEYTKALTEAREQYSVAEKRYRDNRDEISQAQQTVNEANNRL